MKRYLLTPWAASDLQGIKDYIAKDSTTAARRVVREIRAEMLKAAESPGTEHRHQDLDDSVKVRVVYSYLIIYDPATRPIQVLRVLHGSMDLPNLSLAPADLRH